MSTRSPYDIGLDRNAANHAPLTPLSFIERAASVHPERTAIVHGRIRRTWAETYARCRRLASALARRGIGRGDTVAIMAPNVPAMYEAHFGVPMAGAVLNALNVRLDAATIAFILEHGEARALITDTEFAPVIRDALARLGRDILVIDIDDPEGPGGERLGAVEYEDFLAEGDPGHAWHPPADEWDAIALNYTSGTTGNPKGVVYHHRGAYLNAIGNVLAWNMTAHPVYLWTLPMFHCNGWCFPWTLALLAGTSVCLRKVEAGAIYRAIAEEGVTHFCGAPVVLGMVIHASEAERRPFGHRVEVMTAASAPPAAVLEAMERLGFRVTHVYGLTEVYGPAVVCDWKAEWDALPMEEQARIKARQGVRYHVLEGLMVADPETLRPVPRDGATLGEVFMRGHIVMKGYLKNPKATEEAFRGGWFHTGDLAVWHPDGYIELKDRSKDIIISGGENISTIEVEGVLYRHPAVLEAAVVAKPDPKWGETPCAFVTLKEGAEASAEEIIAFCRQHLARFKVPRTVVFGPLPKTSTGKIQKFVLRERARRLAEGQP
ncbi:acyl-CoA synthetase [Inmirania thermothiophila]|uniref:Fatty-acyl-CoA synthase n=1 Tax=Inmirania thermothiophila TaxID=1750597 RepID=A0A3N1Y0Q0_9GAMM|nr:acyl-CoA synthetase [Inmirania thermothiophila]ROR32413.1 fatty-acyl-CoA synthase [Inmirania thermothiophila]